MVKGSTCISTHQIYLHTYVSCTYITIILRVPSFSCSPTVLIIIISILGCLYISPSNKSSSSKHHTHCSLGTPFLWIYITLMYTYISCSVYLLLPFFRHHHHHHLSTISSPSSVPIITTNSGCLPNSPNSSNCAHCFVNSSIRRPEFDM